MLLKKHLKNKFLQTQFSEIQFIQKRFSHEDLIEVLYERLYNNTEFSEETQKKLNTEPFVHGYPGPKDEIPLWDKWYSELLLSRSPEGVVLKFLYMNCVLWFDLSDALPTYSPIKEEIDFWNDVVPGVRDQETALFPKGEREVEVVFDYIFTRGPWENNFDWEERQEEIHDYWAIDNLTKVLFPGVFCYFFAFIVLDIIIDDGLTIVSFLEDRNEHLKDWIRSHMDYELRGEPHVSTRYPPNPYYPPEEPTKSLAERVREVVLKDMQKAREVEAAKKAAEAAAWDKWLKSWGLRW